MSVSITSTPAQFRRPLVTRLVDFPAMIKRFLPHARIINNTDSVIKVMTIDLKHPATDMARLSALAREYRYAANPRVKLSFANDQLHVQGSFPALLELAEQIAGPTPVPAA